MTTRTRYFVIVSLLVMFVGVGHGARGLLRRAPRWSIFGAEPAVARPEASAG